MDVLEENIEISQDLADVLEHIAEVLQKDEVGDILNEGAEV